MTRKFDIAGLQDVAAQVAEPHYKSYPWLSLKDGAWVARSGRRTTTPATRLTLRLDQSCRGYWAWSTRTKIWNGREQEQHYVLGRRYRRLAEWVDEEPPVILAPTGPSKDIVVPWTPSLYLVFEDKDGERYGLEDRQAYLWKLSREAAKVSEEADGDGVAMPIVELASRNGKSAIDIVDKIMTTIEPRVPGQISLAEMALASAKSGFAVFPLAAFGKLPMAGSNGVKGWMTDLDAVQAAWARTPDANIAIATGSPSGVDVVDEDNKGEHAGTIALNELGFDVPETLTTRTPTGGFHRFFTKAANQSHLQCSVSAVADGVDIRGDGGYVVAAGSWVPAGRYEIETEAQPVRRPDWLSKRVRLTSDSGIVTRDVPVELPDTSTLQARALAYLDADNYQTWVLVGMALKASFEGENAFGLWAWWSREDTGYDLSDGELWAKWQTFHHENHNAPITWRSVEMWAKDAGWVPPSIDEIVTDIGAALYKDSDPEGKVEPGWLEHDDVDHHEVHEDRPLAGLGRLHRAKSGREAFRAMLDVCAFVATTGEVYDTETGTRFPSVPVFLRAFHKHRIEVVENDNAKVMPVGKLWEIDGRRITIDDFRSLYHEQPGLIAGPRGNQLWNTWRGLDFSTPGGDGKPFMDFLEHLIPDRTERHHFKLWLGHKLTNPHIPQWAVVMVAGENTFGTGRGTLAKLMRKMFGDEYVVQPDFTQLTETDGQNVYNEWQLALVAFVDEAESNSPTRSRTSKRKSAMSTLRARVDPSGDGTGTVIKRKGLPNYAVDRLAISYIICCHGAGSLDIAAGDRRFGVLRNGDPMSSDMAAEINKLLGDKATVHAFARDIVAYFGKNQADHEAYRIPFRSEMKERMIEISQPPHERAFKRACEEMPGDVATVDDILDASARCYAEDAGLSLIMPRHERDIDDHKRAVSTYYLRNLATADARPDFIGDIPKSKLGRKKAYILRNEAQWKKAKGPELREEMMKNWASADNVVAMDGRDNAAVIEFLGGAQPRGV